MKSKSLASSLSVLASVAIVAACGGTSTPNNGFTTTNNNGGGHQDAGGFGDDDSGSVGTGDNGGSSGGLNMTDAGAPPDLSDAGCATATATATRQPVYLLFVLDGSGSMGDSNKWTAATGALGAIFSDMQKAADPGVGAGLIGFSDTKDKSSGNGPYPSSADVSIAFVDSTQLSKLQSRIGGQPGGLTPTGTAIGAPSGGAFAELTSYSAVAPLPPGGKKVLVLITDGVPTDACSTNGDGSDNYQQNACVTKAASEWAAGQGIETFVIGVGSIPGDFSNYDPYFLGALAQAGGSAPAGCDPKANTVGAKFCYFEVDPGGSSSATQTAFENAINAIRGQVASCIFPLQTTDAGTIDPSKVNVTVNGNPIYQDPNNGWSYTDPSDTSIQLNGTACDTVKNTPNSTVNIVLGCATVTPPPAK